MFSVVRGHHLLEQPPGDVYVSAATNVLFLVVIFALAILNLAVAYKGS